VAVIVVRLFKILFLLIITLLIYAAFPSQTQVISKQLLKEYPKSLIVGLIGLLLFPVLFLFLLLTIVGIPLAILLLPLAVIGGFLMGGTAFSYNVGRFVQTRCKFKISSPFILIGLGILILELPPLFGKFIQLLTPLFSWLFVIIGIVLILGFWIPGFGAVIITRFGTRPRSSKTQKIQQ
jgi:hypothetical protein